MTKLKKSITRFSMVFLTAAMLLIAAGCGNSGSESNTGDGGEVVINFPTYKAGENVGAALFLGQVERFNEKYDGQYEIVVEETPQAAYAEKIQQLAQQNKLPVIVHGTGSGGLSNQWFNDIVIKNDLFYDIAPWLEENSDIKDLFIEESIEFNTTEDGKVPSLPIFIVKSPFIFYNEEMYSPDMDIRDMSWDEFLNSIGDHKIAFQTGENAWTTGLFWTAVLASDPAGQELLQNTSVGELTDLNNPVIIESVEKIKNMFIEHGASNSLGAIYADAANAFMSKNAAFIANGPWMTPEFDEESSDKWSNGFDGSTVRGDYFPGNIGISGFEARGDWIANTATDEEKEAALAWFSFIMSPEEIETALLLEGGQTPNFETSEEYKAELEASPILYSIEEATTEETTFVPNILDLLPASVAENEIAKFLPELINGNLTPEEFCNALTEKAQ